MNAPNKPGLDVPSLVTLALACLAPPEAGLDAASEALWLKDMQLLNPAAARDPQAAFATWLAAPPVADAALLRLRQRLKLNNTELLAVALALASDSEVMTGRALAWLQAPHREAWPTVGLITCLAGLMGVSAQQALSDLLDGAALASGLLKLESRGRALPDAALCMPLQLVLAANQGRGRWPDIDESLPSLTLPESVVLGAQAQARALGRCGSLVVASGHAQEARAVAAQIARALALRPVFIHGEQPEGFGPWLALRQALPVICASAAPGERKRVKRPLGYDGVMLIASGPDGSWELDDESIVTWRIPVPSRDERAQLWQACAMDAESAQHMAAIHRHASARIHSLAQQAQAVCRAEAAETLAYAHVLKAARSAGGSDLGALAEALTEDVDDSALVLPPSLRSELEALSARCRARDGLANDLGPAARTRYKPGVRALFVGASGTGKTLSASWLATRLGMPLYRVDLASVSSKYIGETEKNLGDLFARAEHAEVILLFDEADALFGKRTDVKDANDRYANQQTNYLLQRIESFEGIVLLTSNSRSRFDTAFTRRLDAILDFPAPSAEERRALWQAHLGEAHALDLSSLNRLAAGCDFAGGHIRNVVLAARALAGQQAIDKPALAQALAAEYRKLGKNLPASIVAQ